MPFAFELDLHRQTSVLYNFFSVHGWCSESVRPAIKKRQCSTLETVPFVLVNIASDTAFSLYHEQASTHSQSALID